MRSRMALRYGGAIAFFVLFALHCSVTAVLGAEKWSGVDESVVEKIAKEHGREAREPVVNMDKGDLLLFVFLVAGAAGGFVAGYSWRRLTEGRSRGKDEGGNGGTA